MLVFTDIDDKADEPDLRMDIMHASLTSTFFTYGVGAATVNDEKLTVFLDDLAKASGGGYWGIDGPPAPPEAMRLLVGITQRTWRVRFAADGLPDGQDHDLTITVRDSAQRSGQARQPYRAGTLDRVSPIIFRNIEDGERLTADRDIKIEIQGGHAWQSSRLELFRECEPARCTPVASASDGPLDWRIAVGNMDQGTHNLTARLTVSDGTREFTSLQTIGFERTGTTWNWPVLVLVAGLAAIGIAVTVIQMRRTRLVTL